MIRYKTIMIHEDTHTELKRFGNVTESFDDVIRKLIQKAASDSESCQGAPSQTAAKPNRNSQETITAK